MKPRAGFLGLVVTALSTVSVGHAGRDVMVAEITSPRRHIIPVWQRPSIRLRNVGTTVESLIPADFQVDSAGVEVYHKRVTVAGPIEVGAERVVPFSIWEPGSGYVGYRLRAYVSMAGDVNRRNDTIAGTTWVIPWFELDTVTVANAPEPEIDGQISPEEYEWPPGYDVSDVLGRTGTAPQPPGTCLFYGSTTQQYAFFAIDLRTVFTRQDGDMVIVYMDENNDGQFIAGDSTEGAHFVFVRGGQDSVVYSQAPGEQCPGAVSASSVDNGNLQFEWRIPFGTRKGDYTVNPLQDATRAAISAWRARGRCFGWWPRNLPLLEWGMPGRYGRMEWYTVSICDTDTPDVARPARSYATVAHNVLLPPPVRGAGPEVVGVLLDISGRKVGELRPGANDVRHLSPGVYFTKSPADDVRAVSKIIITR